MADQQGAVVIRAGYRTSEALRAHLRELSTMMDKIGLLSTELEGTLAGPTDELDKVPAHELYACPTRPPDQERLVRAAQQEPEL